MSRGQGLKCAVLGVERMLGGRAAGRVGGGESFDKILGKRERERKEEGKGKTGDYVDR